MGFQRVFPLAGVGAEPQTEPLFRRTGAELNNVLGTLALVKGGNECVNRGAGHEILLPGDLVGRVRLALRSGAEADAGDAVAALNGDAVGRERPFVDERAMAQVHGVRMPDALFAVERFMRVRNGLHVGGGFLVDPGGEVALGLVDETRPCGTVVHVHAHLCAVLLAGGEVLDLLEAGLPGFAGGHTAVNGNGAAVRNRAAGGGGVKNLRNGAGAAAKEARVLVMIRVELGVEHLDEPFDFVALRAAVGVERFNLLDDFGHLVNGVVAAFRRAAVAGDAGNVHADFHASAMPAVNAAVGRFSGNNKLRRNAVFLMDVLPAEAVAVLFLNGGGDEDFIPFRNEAEVLHDLCAVDGGNHAALLVGSAAPVDDVVGFITLIGILLPVGDVADADGVDMPVERDNLIAGTHPAKGIALRVDFGLVEAKRFHFANGALDNAFLFAAFARNGDQVAEKTGHLRFVGLRRLFNFGGIHGACSSFLMPRPRRGRGQSFFASM
ncbi:hypothetical protein SDC9_69918 [bioreactor metagenome]|uniref:Uncharacterized protein n=1 Tax=bioreactor metagenome TaxID=1076179 RepID=A0A644Y4F4_9ZZZZ